MAEPKHGPELVRVPGGSVVLHDARRDLSREVILEPFEIGRYPVTREQYGAAAPVADTHGTRASEATTPAGDVSWWDAIRWCNQLSDRLGLDRAYEVSTSGGAAGAGAADVRWEPRSEGYRLPTEAEWELACRAGSAGPRYGDLAEIAWSAENSLEGAQPVGGKRPNRLGLHDMLGNVWEWCWDLADPARYGDYRVMRGGGWADRHWSVRASVRRGSMPQARFDDLGFRVARGAVAPTHGDELQGWSAARDAERGSMSGPMPVGWTPLGRAAR